MRVCDFKVLLLVAASAIVSVVATPPGDQFQKVAFIGSAKVREVTGAVEVFQNKQWQQLKRGAELPVGAHFRTKADSVAVIQMTESRSLVRVQAQTAVRLASAAEGMAFDQSHSVVPAGGCVVRALRGQAEVKRGLWWANLEVGDVLAAGVRIRTAPEGAIDLFFANQSKLVRVGESLSLRLDLEEIGDRTLIGRVPAVFGEELIATASLD